MWVSFKNDKLADEFEKQLLAGFDWYATGMIVTGQRLDKPSLQVRLRGVADDIEEETIVGIMGQFGTVISCTRGIAPMARRFEPGSPQ